MSNRPSDIEAEQYLRLAIDLAPGNASHYANFAFLLDADGRRDEAEYYYREAVTREANSPGYRLILADFLANSPTAEHIAEAKAIYLDVLTLLPTHHAAWSNLGALLFKTGYISAAQTAYTAAIAYCPGDATLHASLARIALYLENLDIAKKHFLHAIALDPALAEAHQGLACIFHRQNQEMEAQFHRDKGFGSTPIVTLPWHGRNRPRPLLILTSAMEGNIPWRLLVDQDVYQSTIATVEYLERPQQLDLATYSLIFNAIGDADLCRSALETAECLLAKMPSPAINAPAAVLCTGRLENSLRLSRLPGVTTPRMIPVSKTDIDSGLCLQRLTRNGWNFPLLLRAPGFHGGNHFVRAESPDVLRQAAHGLPGENLLAVEWLDAGDEDARFRKYRVMIIDGVLYPLHMAISTQWKVHYFSSDMKDSLPYREQEQAFLQDFTAALGASAVSGLQQVAQTLGLDYCGIDFGLDSSGRVLLYEANATMAIVPPDHDPCWDYKRISIDNALAAVKAMFAKRMSLQV